MKQIIVSLPTEETSVKIAQQFANCLRAPLVLTFCGPIGAGKTTFIRALLRELGIQSAIKSPTFSLVESYEANDVQLHHFDLYRIQDEAELDYIGFRDYFSDNTICCIEWPEQAPGFLEKVDIKFELTIKDRGREMKAQAVSLLGIDVLSCMMRA